MFLNIQLDLIILKTYYQLFVLKRDVKLQLTHSPAIYFNNQKIIAYHL